MTQGIDLSKLKTYSIRDRKSKVSITDAAKRHTKGSSFADFVLSLPDFLAAKDIKALVECIIDARRALKQVVLGMGAHPIKVGLQPIIIDLIERGIITALASNGASIVHDFETAYNGATSEDVSSEIDNGSFGMARETGQMLNNAIKSGRDKGLGIGMAIGEFIAQSDFPHRDLSIFACCYRNQIPATVHVAIGSDIIHMHPEADGAAIGEASLRDFRTFTETLTKLDGGVYLNLGSSVIMPEVFLKALTTARNLGFKVKDLTTANLDFIQHYRPGVNVLKRPTQLGGRHFAITGHHEIMLPLLSAMIIEQM